MAKQKVSYKEPHLLFTSGSLRFAAWAGWYSARGEKKLAEGISPHFFVREVKEEILYLC